jgi:hypothetical protein
MKPHPHQQVVEGRLQDASQTLVFGFVKSGVGPTQVPTARQT